MQKKKKKLGLCVKWKKTKNKKQKALSDNGSTKCSWAHVIISFIQPLSAEVMNLTPSLIFEPFEDAPFTFGHNTIISFACYYPSYVRVSDLTLL